MTHHDKDWWLDDDAYLDDPLHEEDYHWGPFGGYPGDNDEPEDCEPPEPEHAVTHKLDDCPFDQSKGG